MSKLASALLIPVILGTFGCSELKPRIDVNSGKILGIPPTYNYKDPTAANYYKTAVVQAQDKRGQRNRVIFELMGIIDSDYATYEMALRSDRAYKDIAFKVVSLTLTGVASLAPELTAHRLAAIDTGLKGANESIDTTAFKNQAPELLINRMRANRSAVAQRIYDSMNNDESQYPIEAALRDVDSYYSEGSVTSALASLASSTAIEASAAASAAESKKLGIR